jgi:hypothetical protein
VLDFGAHKHPVRAMLVACLSEETIRYTLRSRLWV